VLPGVYNVALMVGGKAVSTKQIKIVADPMNPLTVAERKRYYDVAMDLHEMQRKGTKVVTALEAIDAQMTSVAGAVKASKAPAVTKTSFDTYEKEYNSICAKFGIGAAAAGGGRGGRGGGGGGGRGGAAAGGGAGAAPTACPSRAAAGRGAAVAAAPADTSAAAEEGPTDVSNIFGRVAALKAEILASSAEPVTGAQLREYNEVKLAFPPALASANAFLTRTTTMSTTLKRYDVTLTPPPSGQ
jgi:hypothetical protein